jgi:hypothetical protein
MQLRLAALGSLFLLSCASGSTHVESARDFTSKGEVDFLQGSASWDETRVVGPLINVSRRSDGSWAGQLNNQILDVNVYRTRAAGAFLTMTWEDQPEQRVIIAQWLGRLHRFEIYPDRVLYRGPTHSFTLHNLSAGAFGPGGELKFQGQAREERAPMPQFGLALLATFLATEAQSHDPSGFPTMPRR